MAKLAPAPLASHSARHEAEKIIESIVHSIWTFRMSWQIDTVMLALLHFQRCGREPHRMSSSSRPSHTFLALLPHCCLQPVLLAASVVVVPVLVWLGSNFRCIAPWWTPPKTPQSKLPDHRVMRKEIMWAKRYSTSTEACTNKNLTHQNDFYQRPSSRTIRHGRFKIILLPFPWLQKKCSKSN
jgi:hypothetical protein